MDKPHAFGAAPAGSPVNGFPVNAEPLLPHTGTMCCIDLLASCLDGGAEALVALRPEHALLDSAGCMDSFGYIELAAQTAAAMHGFQAGDNRPDLAMLVGVQKFAAPGIARAGDTLRISVSVLGGLEGMLSLGFAVRPDCEDAPPLAEGRLSVFVPEADDGRLDSMATRAASNPEREIPANGAAVPQNLPDSLGRYVIDGPAVVEDAGGKVKVAAVYLFTPGFPGFDGHFPGNPIVPGIVQLMAAAHTASGGRRWKLESLSRCKFLRPVFPGEKIRVQAEVEKEEGAIRCRVRHTVDSEPCAESAFVLESSEC